MPPPRSPARAGRAARPQHAPSPQAFQHSRAARRTEIAEDYVELIRHLIATRGEARAVDIAAALGVAAATVAKTLDRLQRQGLVSREPYRAIFLTPEGEAVAAAAERRHALVLAVLRALGVDEATAERDAEGVEHHISAATLEAFERWLNAGAPPPS